MKHKKFSKAILCGYEMVDGEQHFGGYANAMQTAVCVLGAAALCEVGSPRAAIWDKAQNSRQRKFIDRFIDAWGIQPAELNDKYKMPWEHIYGMAKAAGL